MTRLWTIGILLFVTFGLIAWDIYVATNREKRDTISVVMLDTARKHPAIPFLLGVIMGHLFWPQ